MKTSIYTLITVVILFYNCSNKYCNKLNIALTDTYDSNTNENIIDFKEVYDFEWDILYIFKEYENADTISEIIGFDCDCKQVQDLEEVFIFVKDSEIIEIDYGECNGYSLITKINICCDGAQKIYSHDSKFSILKSSSGMFTVKPLSVN